jgi:hypothetical protein
VFYYAYKFGSPIVSGQIDYFAYYKIYSTLEISGVDAPTNMRLISSFLVNLFYNSGLQYDIPIGYDVPSSEKAVYLASILVSFLASVLTSAIIDSYLKRKTENELIAFVGGSLFLFQYGTVFWGATGLADAFSTMLFALALVFYLNRSFWVLLFLALAIIQREVILIAFAALTFFDALYQAWKSKKYKIDYPTKVFFATLICFIGYIVLRDTVFYTERWAGHTDVSAYARIFNYPEFSLGQYLRGSILSQNVFILYLALLIFKRSNAFSFDTHRLWLVTGVFLSINLVCFLLIVLPQAGRYFFIASPMLVIFFAEELNGYLGASSKKLMDGAS